MRLTGVAVTSARVEASGVAAAGEAAGIVDCVEALRVVVGRSRGRAILLAEKVVLGLLWRVVPNWRDRTLVEVFDSDF